ncbi:LamG domain-containing protein [Candidatus Pelagibacter sp.]|nr:LamG domain-containing protein [Candidatus Pelagibacter sp.]
MAFDPPDGILDIGNATLRVGKLEVAETSGLNQGLQNIVKNDLLVTENNESSPYTTNQKWGLKLPTTWVAEFEVKGHSGKYIDFNFYNENSASNAQGYNLTFMDTTMTLRYDGGSALGGGAVTIPTIVGAYRKVNIFFERGVISVSIDGTRYLYHKESDGFNQGLGVASRVVSATGSAFVNLFIEQNAANSAFKNLRIVNGRFISDKTSNIAFIGGNLGVGVNSPQEALDIRGNMHLTRVSNVSQISVDSNVVTEYTGPHDRPLRKYPEVAMTANDNSTTSGYVASGSSKLTGTEPYHTLDGNLNSYLHSRYPYYSTSTGAYSPGSALDGQSPSGTLATNELVSGHQGEWISIELPKKIKLEKLKVIGSTRLASGINQFPKDVVVAVSETGLSGSWSALETATLISQNVSNHSDTINITTQTSYYKYFALIVKSINSTATYSAVEIAELEYYGHEEGSGSLDTTLKTVYNVPATTGTQLEVYYDAKDLADGAVSTPVLGLGGTTINATVYGDPQVSGGAFVFDGTGDYIKTSALPSTFVDDAQHSFSTWFKLDTTTGSQTLFTIGDADGDNQLPHVVVQDGTLRYDFYNNSRTLLDLSLVSNQWYHLAITFSGGNHNSGTKFYINGMYDANVNSGGNNPNANLDIQASSPLTIGGRHNGTQLVAGSIANFRLYSKALNADQVKELYDYQKDYFLGSKSQVTLYKGHLGVGVTEPSGQLELAGDERIQEYPPRDLGGFETIIEGQGTYKVSSSSDVTDPNVGDNDHPATLFTANDTFFRGVNSAYAFNTSVPALYTGTHFTNGVGGDFVQIELPHKIYLKSINITSRTSGSNYSDRAPHTGFIFGSNNGGTTWSQVASWSGLTWTLGESKPIQINSSVLYSTYRLVANKLANTSGGASRFNIDRWQLFGTPGPTTLDKGSLSLTRSLDVPRVSRYDVDTETPRYEKLLVDFDTTVNSSPTDISGQGNHGTFRGTASYSAADKAFKFDGAGATYIYRSGASGIPSGDAIYSIVGWVNVEPSITTFGQLLTFGSAWGVSTIGALAINTSYGFQASIGGDAVKSPDGVITPNTWHHIAAVKVATGVCTVDTYDLYLDGVLITNKTYVGSNRTQNIGTGTKYLAVGGGFTGAVSDPFDGLISNPKIYSVALEPSEVKKLYNLGRTGRSMVISDTAVGIGKVPEAQLDVRGIIKGQSPAVFIAKANAAMTATAAGAIALFGTVVTDTAGGWDSVNHRYYAKVPGFYLVNAAMFTIVTTNVYVVIRIDKNGVEYSSTTGFAGPGGYPNTSLTTLIYLEVGDYVRCRIGTDTNRTTASSHRLEIVHVGM